MVPKIESKYAILYTCTILIALALNWRIINMASKTIYFNSNLHVKVENIGEFIKQHLSNIRVSTCNIGNGVNEQKYKPFDTRIEKHLKDFGDMKPDILAIQEFRNFPESKVSPEEFCESIRKTLGSHRHILQFRNPSP